MQSDPTASAAAEVLEFWFGPPPDTPRKIWFAKDTDFDNLCRTRFATMHEAAMGGALSAWEGTPDGALALTILLDQLSRNIYRDSPRAFAQDALALAVATRAIERMFDTRLGPLRRMFLYLPFEHSEDGAMQARSVELFESLRGHADVDEGIDYAHRHRAVIERFGRFPHRNAVLGRESSPEELAYLRTPGSGF